MKNLILFLFILGIYGSLAFSADDHKEGEEHAHAEGEHADEANHDDEESSTTVGPDKGITEKAEAGFKLSTEAIKTMEIKSVPYAGGNLNLPVKALVQIKDEKTVFRIRDGWIKRVSVQVLQKGTDSFSITSKSFRDTDQIVTEGVGFLRISEIFSEEGASHGHSH